jgi:hypothetical protein
MASNAPQTECAQSCQARYSPTRHRGMGYERLDQLALERPYGVR